MFGSQLNKVKYEFYTINKETLYDNMIEPMSSLRLPWRDNIVSAVKNDKDRPIKSRSDICSGISLVVNHGWVVKSWTDMVVRLNHDTGEFHVQFPNPNPDRILNAPPIGTFPPFLFTKHAKTLDGTFPTLLKINSPWRFKCPKGWGILYSPLQYHNQENFYSATGMLDPRHINELHPILFIHSKKDEFMIKQGQPLFQLIPVPLRNFDYLLRDATPKEHEWESMVAHILQTRYTAAKKSFSDMYSRFFGDS
jgi:hypothetical protein